MHLQQHFPLGQAYYCVDCNSVHNSSHDCPACASKAVWPLTKWISEMATKYAEKETVNG